MSDDGGTPSFSGAQLAGTNQSIALNPGRWHEAREVLRGHSVNVEPPMQRMRLIATIFALTACAAGRPPPPHQNTGTANDLGIGPTAKDIGLFGATEGTGHGFDAAVGLFDSSPPRDADMSPDLQSSALRDGAHRDAAVDASAVPFLDAPPAFDDALVPDASSSSGDASILDASPATDVTVALDVALPPDVSFPATGVDSGNDSSAAGCPGGSAGGQAVTVSARVMMSSDDAEENVIGNSVFPAGHVYLDSSDLELTEDTEFDRPLQVVGLRFSNVQVPPAAVIQEARVEFVADRDLSRPTSLTVFMEASDNATTFRNASFDITGRPRVMPTIDWSNVPQWTVDMTYLTPDLSAALQDVVCRPGWRSGNAVVVIVEGTGEREAVAYDQTPASAASLHITYRH